MEYINYGENKISIMCVIFHVYFVHEFPGERERERCVWMHIVWHTKDRIWVMKSSEMNEEETFRVDCAEEEAWTLGFLMAEPVAVLLH